MKQVLTFCILVLSLQGAAQIVTADPAIGAMNFRNIVTDEESSRKITTTTAVKLVVPILNLSQYSAIPPGSTQIIIGLGNRLILDPTFNLATARLSNYFLFTYNTMASQPRIIATQIAPIPMNFIDSTFFHVIGTADGSSAVSANFSIIPTGFVDDADGNNNSTSTSYTVMPTPLPVTITQFDVQRRECNIHVSFRTEHEVNVAKYEVEISKDGGAFNTLAEMEATQAGRYTGVYPITEAIRSANLWVRLKSIDKDGQVQYSLVKKIAGTCGAGPFVLGVYPNPIQAGNAITISNRQGLFDGRYRITLIDMNGRTLKVMEMTLSNVASFPFQLSNAPAGTYLLKVVNTNDSESALLRIEKQD